MLNKPQRQEASFPQKRESSQYRLDAKDDHQSFQTASKGCSAWGFGYEILRCAQYDKVWGTQPPSACHAESSEAQSKHLYMLASHLGRL